MVIDRLLTFYEFSFSGRTRTKDKYRVVYSDHQRLELEKEFHYSRYITIRRKAELANSVGLSERQVRISQFFVVLFSSTYLGRERVCLSLFICTGVVNSSREKSANTCTKVRKTFHFYWNHRKTWILKQIGQTFCWYISKQSILCI